MAIPVQIGSDKRVDFVSKVSDLYAHSFRGELRKAALSMLGRGYELLGRNVSMSRPRVQVLAMHHVLDDEIDGFRRLLGYLSKGHTFVSYDEAINRIQFGAIDRPYLAITFDDGLLSAFNAAKILDEFGIPGCYFIATRAMDLNSLEEMARFSVERLEVGPLPFMGWREVESLLKRGHTVGAHTRTHAHIPGLSTRELEDEIEGSFEDLRRRVGRPEHFAWPFGRFTDFTREAADIVFRSGFQSCASGERGSHSVKEPEVRRLCVRRDLLLPLWPLSHVNYFLARSARRTGASSNAWPEMLVPSATA